MEKIDWYKLYNSETEAKQEMAINSTRKVRVSGRVICIIRTVSGFFAIDDACPHLGESLSKGTVNYLEEIVCPWHSYRFSLKDGEECEKRSKALHTHSIKIDVKGVFLGVNSEKGY
ncbi:MAG: Rieske 2Fe-2S domain-containing protein [Bacteroidota bacterium]